MSEQRLGGMGGMGLPTRLTPRGDPENFKLLGANESPRQQIFGCWPKMGPHAAEPRSEEKLCLNSV